MTLCNDLIPTNGVRITENQFPKGFMVAKYDAEGFTSDGRWFETRTKADAYAAQLAVTARHRRAFAASRSQGSGPRKPHR